MRERELLHRQLKVKLGNLEHDTLERIDLYQGIAIGQNPSRRLPVWADRECVGVEHTLDTVYRQIRKLNLRRSLPLMIQIVH